MDADAGAVRELIEAAKRASRNAYCKYSGFRVGAAVLGARGGIFAGCNVENASYGLTICAERNAVFQMVAAGETEIAALAVYTPTDHPTAPCGACRQVIYEFGPDALILCVCNTAEEIRERLGVLLPQAFGPKNLGREGGK
jgi:cytidine deaminase